MPIPSITFMCPSRERANLVQNSIESVLRTTGEKYQNEYLIAIDIDDSQMEEYEQIVRKYNSEKLKVELFVCPPWGYHQLNNYYNLWQNTVKLQGFGYGMMMQKCSPLILIQK